MNFVFDEEKHLYLLDNRPLLSVTQALKGAGLVEYDNLPIAPDVLERARARGKAVHAACHYLDEGDLDWSTLDPSLVGYVKAWQKFKDESGIIIEQIEHKFYHPSLLFAGTPDRVATRMGRRGVYDIKTYECAAWTGLQLSGYELGLRPAGEAPWDRWGVWLKPEGTYKLQQFTNRNDVEIFKACLTVATWKAANGGNSLKAT